uniref:inorganic diphosphatase n=1 Tax=Heterorhabditis bacteriophora TaxID=37862 RepID=A0A1I7XDK7_HETBA
MTSPMWRMGCAASAGGRLALCAGLTNSANSSSLPRTPFVVDDTMFRQQQRSAHRSLTSTQTFYAKAVAKKEHNMGSTDSVSYEKIERGSLYGNDYRIFFKGPNGFISPWHDIPLYADEANKVFNMVVEIPRWSNAKMEGYIWNYGALPQTWENPSHVVSETGAKGDNDPIDVVEIGSKVHCSGDIVQVKVLGTLALIDEGETDWKLVSIDVNDPLATEMNSIGDVEKHFPGLLKATVEWFRIYKIPAGKPANEFAFNGEYKDREYAHKIIEETNKFWKALIKEVSPKLNTLMGREKDVSTRLIRPTVPEIDITQLLMFVKRWDPNWELDGSIKIYDEGIAQYMLVDPQSHYKYFAAIILSKPSLRCKLVEEEPEDLLDQETGNKFSLVCLITKNSY